MAKLNKRKCAECGVEFQKQAPLQNCCSIPCAVNRSYKLNKAKREKLLCDKVKDMKVGLKTKGEYIQLLQAVFNTYIRERDKDLPCISCDVKTSNKWDAGHFYPTTYSYLRFNEDNVHKQCSKNCNLEKHGNMSEYRPRLIERIGIARVTILDNSRHLKLELSIPEIQELIKEYKFKIKELKK